MRLSLEIPPHLKCVATLPCKILSVFKKKQQVKTRRRQKLIKRPTLIVTKFFINKLNFRKTLTKC